MRYNGEVETGEMEDFEFVFALNVRPDNRKLAYATESGAYKMV